MISRRSMFEEWRAVLWRRRAYFLIPALLISAVTILAAFLLPPVYRSSATILLEEPVVSNELVATTVSGSPDQQLQAINKRITSSNNLLQMIDEYDLYPASRKKDPPEKLVAKMRKDIVFWLESVEINDPEKGLREASIALNIGFQYKDPAVAQRVAERLVTLFIEAQADERLKTSRQANAFVNKESERLSQSVDDLRKKLAAFREQYADVLPEMEESNRKGFEAADKELPILDAEIRAQNQRRVELEAELATSSPYRSYTLNGETVLNPNDQLEILQNELAKMSATFGPSYPPLLDLKKRIAELAAAAQNRGPTARSRGRMPDNPAYLQVSAALKAAEGNLRSLTARRDEMKSRLADYEGRLRQTQVIAGEYAHLRQSLDQAVEQHRKVEEKRAAAEIAETLEHEGKGRRLSVVDPPIVPHKPAQPIRLILIGLGLALAALGGLGAAVAAEYFDPRIYSARQLKSLTGEAPLASIPFIDHRLA